MSEPAREVPITTPGPTRRITSRLESLAGSGRRNPVSYDGPFANPMTGAETSRLKKLGGMTLENNPLYQLGSDQISKTIRGDYLRPGSNPYLQSLSDTISEDATKKYGMAVDDTNAFLNKGGVLNSTGGNRLRRQATDDFGRNLNNSLTALYSDNYNMERGNQLSALSTGLQYGSSPFDQNFDLFGLEGLPRQIADRQSQGEYQEFLRTEGVEDRNAGLEFEQLMQLLEGYPLTQPSYIPGRSEIDNFSQIATPLALLAGSFAGGPAGGLMAGSLARRGVYA